MIPAIIEKLAHVATVATLYARGRINQADAGTALPDLVLGLLFVAAFARTPRRGDEAVQTSRRL
jgi:hypothetical protein